ncbi:unnamed protein product [Phytophthora fragariaefolia]|uniref:Unnamed protein product n=1 Tax=Phytophthora fragariaefolia TaxID=1490495 RepID=A0A9W7CSX5_9STRA|nr:unnamed protein product [Phytophthora fragariaefolia]
MVSSRSASAISCLRSCHPSSPSFPSAVEKVFHDLAAIETTPVLSNSSSSDSLSARSGSTASQVPAPCRKVRAGGPSTISEASFLQLLQQLSVDFPKHIQTRVLEAVLSGTNTASTKESLATQGVGLVRFHRGVQACLLVEELIDAVTLLFQSLESHSSGLAGLSGVIAADTLMNALRSAATSQFPRELTSMLTALLSRSLVTRPTLALADMAKSDVDTDLEIQTKTHLLQINEVYDLLFDLIFLD